MEDLARELGTSVEVAGFVRYGLERESRRRKATRRRGRGRSQRGVPEPEPVPADQHMTGKPRYRRILVKVSGEALIGEGEHGSIHGRQTHRR